MLNKRVWKKVIIYYIFLILCSMMLSFVVGFATTIWLIIMLLIVAFVGVPLAIQEIKRHRKELQDKEPISVGDVRVR